MCAWYGSVMTIGWMNLVVSRDRETGHYTIQVGSPPEMVGRMLVRVDARPCSVVDPAEPPYASTHSICGLVRDHSGDHVSCSPELFNELLGALAILKVPKRKPCEVCGSPSRAFEDEPWKGFCSDECCMEHAAGEIDLLDRPEAVES